MKRLANTLATALALVAGTGGIAAAQRSDAAFDPLTMDRHTPVSKLDLDFAYVAYDVPANSDLTVMGFAIGGQYVTQQGIGGYLSIPLAYVSLQIDQPLPPIFVDESGLSLGNIELGALYTRRLDRRASIVLHGGLALDTSSEDDLSLTVGGVDQALASSPRYGDLVQRVIDSTWLRIGVSPMGRAGKLLWRADLGIDLAIDEERNLAGTSTISPVFRIGLGGGIDLGKAHLLAEFVTVVTDDGSDDETTSTLALGARFISGKLRPGVALIVPVGFDRNVRKPDFALSLSLAARL